ncbi:MarR family winged helix-turn-helix transcriptional regulator [Microbacterium sp. RD1]|uniref:MarR family winged helix-turn-helix transcriptional regulator n=1 Tax=Microbacterium sp. RD1 TaxID=3457313 RepID=UPI003FA5EB3D
MGKSGRTDAYWYPTNGDVERGRRMLHALRMYHAAEMAMRRRTRDAMGMGDNELLALRHVLRAYNRGESITPTDVARYLGISTASTTTLLDRLERSGHLTRGRHASDRRSITLRPTAAAEQEVRDTLGSMHERMMAATAGVSETEAEAIVSFLERVAAAVDEVTAPAESAPPLSATG